MTKLLPQWAPVGVALVGAWLFGFLNFVGDIEALGDPALQPSFEQTDALVVLTGGSERLATGINLLESGAAKKLFISGVHKKLSLEEILRGQPVPASLRACCIVLGYRANSTIGNAEETRDWMRAEHFTSLRLVTAKYHIPRSLLLFRAAMPEITILSHPVSPDKIRLDEWWLHPRTIELLAQEYTKYLLSLVRIAL